MALKLIIFVESDTRKQCLPSHTSRCSCSSHDTISRKKAHISMNTHTTLMEAWYVSHLEYIIQRYVLLVTPSTLGSCIMIQPWKAWPGEQRLAQLYIPLILQIPRQDRECLAIVWLEKKQQSQPPTTHWLRKLATPMGEYHTDNVSQVHIESSL